jgi:hypothetical protein
MTPELSKKMEADYKFIFGVRLECVMFEAMNGNISDTVESSYKLNQKNIKNNGYPIMR